MGEVKWIKMSTALPNSRKIKQIRSLPDGDTIALMWVFLMCLAGDTNDNGLIYFTPGIPYTDEMLSREFDIDITTVRLALSTFEKFGMIEIVNDLISLAAWGKWQSTDRLAEIREYNRLAKQKSRERKRLAAGVNDKSMTSQSCQDTDKEEEREIEEEREKIDYNGIVNAFNAICVSFPAVRTVSTSRKKAIKARLNTYSLEDFKTLFEKAEASSFLKGKNNNNWSANFDWLIKDANMAKVLEGNYDDKQVTYRPSGGKQSKADELNAFYNMASAWAEGE